jgi:ketosteroid isomerase-like protein
MGVGKDLFNEFERTYSKKDWDGAAALFAEDAVHVDPTARQEGRDAIVAWMEGYGSCFSDMSFPASLLVEEGDIVVAEYVFRAMQTATVTMPDGRVVQPGHPQEIPCVTICQIRDGKFINMRDYFDVLDGMAQLGLLPGT